MPAHAPEPPTPEAVTAEVIARERAGELLERAGLANPQPIVPTRMRFVAVLRTRPGPVWRRRYELEIRTEYRHTYSDGQRRWADSAVREPTYRYFTERAARHAASFKVAKAYRDARIPLVQRLL